MKESESIICVFSICEFLAYIDGCEGICLDGMSLINSNTRKCGKFLSKFLVASSYPYLHYIAQRLDF